MAVMPAAMANRRNRNNRGFNFGKKSPLENPCMLEMVKEADSNGIAFSEMKDELKSRMSATEAESLGSPGWHVTVVKLNMEVEGELKRLSSRGPQKVVLA